MSFLSFNNFKEKIFVNKWVVKNVIRVPAPQVLHVIVILVLQARHVILVQLVYGNVSARNVMILVLVQVVVIVLALQVVIVLLVFGNANAKSVITQVLAQVVIVHLALQVAIVHLVLQAAVLVLH